MLHCLQVRIAQQANDDACLAHALASLCQIMAVTTPGTITSVGQARGVPAAARHHAQLNQLLHRCLKRAEELQLPHLVAFAILALAEFELRHQQCQEPSGAAAALGAAPASCSAATHVATAVRDAAHLHLATCLAATVPAAPAMSSGMASARILRGAPDLFGATVDVLGPNTVSTQASCAAEVGQLASTAHLLRAACWDLCGSRHLAQTHTLAYLDCVGPLGKAEDECTALAQLAVSVAARHGHHAAERVLGVADDLFPFSESKVLMMARLAILHDVALHRQDLQDAMHIAQQMTGLASPTDTTDITLRWAQVWAVSTAGARRHTHSQVTMPSLALRCRFEAEERLVRTLLAAGQMEAAVKAAHALFAMTTEAGQPIHSARLLLLLGEIHSRAGAPMVALPYALSCAAHCRQLHLDQLGAEAALLMAELWADLCPSSLRRSQEEVEAVLPLILAHGSLDLQARAQLQLAEVLMAGHPTVEALQADSDWVLELLEAAAAAFKQLEGWEQLARAEYRRALVLDALGRWADRDTAVAAHHKLQNRRSVE